VTLRSRLLVGMAVVALVLVAAAVGIARAAQSYLVGRVDAQLVDAAPPARDAGFFDHDHGGPNEPGPGGGGGGGEEPGGSDTPSFSSLYVGRVEADGTVRTIATPYLADADALPEISAEQATAASAHEQPSPFTVGTEGSSSTRYRILAMPDGGDGDVLLLGLPLGEVDAEVSRLVGVELLVTAVVLAILALVTYWVIRLGVSPIKRMTATATAIAGGELSHRVPDVDTRTEAGQLGGALNTMLGRIEDAFDQRAESEDRLRRFVADASHELRTPVTTIRGYAELYRVGALDDPNDLGQAMRRTEEEAIRMGSLVEDLLLLARLDQGRPLERAPVDLGVLAIDAVRDARAVQPERPITVSTDEGVVVEGDDHRLRQVVANLVGNALGHTPEQTPVHVAVHRDNGRAVLEVRDEGPGMGQEAAARAFERFYRADPARSRRHGGTGLGLAIVKATVEAHGGSVRMDTNEGAGTTVRVELPA